MVDGLRWRLAGSSRPMNWLALCLLWPLKTLSAFASGCGICLHPAFLSALLCGSGRTSQCSELSAGGSHFRPTTALSWSPHTACGPLCCLSQGTPRPRPSWSPPSELTTALSASLGWVSREMPRHSLPSQPVRAKQTLRAIWCGLSIHRCGFPVERATTHLESWKWMDSDGRLWMQTARVMPPTPRAFLFHPDQVSAYSNTACTLQEGV